MGSPTELEEPQMGRSVFSLIAKRFGVGGRRCSSSRKVGQWPTLKGNSCRPDEGH